MRAEKVLLAHGSHRGQGFGGEYIAYVDITLPQKKGTERKKRRGGKNSRR